MNSYKLVTNIPIERNLGVVRSAVIKSKRFDDGSTLTEVIIDPSKKGAASGVVAGAIVGAVLGPGGAAAGALIGGTIGFIFGSKDWITSYYYKITLFYISNIILNYIFEIIKIKLKCYNFINILSIYMGIGFG